MNRMTNHTNKQFNHKQLNTLLAQSPADSYEARPFDLSIAQLENWVIKPSRTRRNGSTGLRRDIKRFINGIQAIAVRISNSVNPIIKRVDNTLDKIQLSAPESQLAQNYSATTLNRFKSHMSVQAPIQAPIQTPIHAPIQASIQQSTHALSRHSNLTLDLDVDLGIQSNTYSSTTSNLSRATSPMKQIAENNLLRDGLTVAVWVTIVPTAMFLGTMAGF